jgi:hypothetical protein
MGDGAFVRWRCGCLLPLALAGCTESAQLTVRDGTGPAPALPVPVHAAIPTVVIAPAIGWHDGASPSGSTASQRGWSRDGALLVADDVGNTIWRVAPAGGGR